MDSYRATNDAAKMRLIRPEEYDRWKSLMNAHHYLGFKRIVGKSLHYVVTKDDQWIAILGWGSAALKCASRDQWIGWDRQLQWRRLHLIANNARFLILPGCHQPNLASYLLALSLKRLSYDWQRCYGHPILLAETFVDKSRFCGTCYRAAGWQLLGQTSGYSKCNRRYWRNGRPKLVFVRPLVPDAAKKLCALFPPPTMLNRKDDRPMIDVNQLPLEEEGGLMQLLKTLVDPRKPRGVRHPIETILAIAVCAVLSGAQSFTAIAEWAEELSPEALRLLGGKRKTPPSEPTIRRVLQKIDADYFDTEIGKWVMQTFPLAGQAIAVDGKTLRGGHDAGQKPPHLLSAILHKEGVVIAQTNVEEKTNEIPKLREMLDPIPLEGSIVTADALHTQKETARFLVEEKQADYLFIIKDNQRNMLQDVVDLNFGDFPPEATTTDKGHGRLELRSIWTSTELNDYLNFPYVVQVFCLERDITELISGKQRAETVYGLTSLPADQTEPSRLLEIARGQWSIENSLHWVRDVSYNEDRCRIRKGYGAQNMASIRNLAISILRMAGARYIPQAFRFCARKGLDVLRLVGVQV